MQSILLWAPGERSEAQEVGEVSLRPLVNLRLLLQGAEKASPAGWKNSSGRWKIVEMPPEPPSSSLLLSMLLLLDAAPWGGSIFFLLLSWHLVFHALFWHTVYRPRSSVCTDIIYLSEKNSNLVSTKVAECSVVSESLCQLNRGSEMIHTDVIWCCQTV